jgi:hypothetical protein
LSWSSSELTVSPISGDAHDALRHYDAVGSDSRWTVLGNGEQVATVFDRLSSGQPPSIALDGLRHEPDPPICTPRITGQDVSTAPRHRHFRTAAGDPDELLAELWSSLDPRFAVAATVFDVMAPGSTVRTTAQP